jgi:hypothetical protein
MNHWNTGSTLFSTTHRFFLVGEPLIVTCVVFFFILSICLMFSANEKELKWLKAEHGIFILLLFVG